MVHICRANVQLSVTISLLNFRVLKIFHLSPKIPQHLKLKLQFFIEFHRVIPSIFFFVIFFNLNSEMKNEMKKPPKLWYISDTHWWKLTYRKLFNQIHALISFQCLILAGDTNQEICDVTKREYSKMLQILGNIKHASQLDNITKELECLVSQLAKKGLVIDASTLKEALYANLFCFNFKEVQITSLKKKQFCEKYHILIRFDDSRL